MGSNDFQERPVVFPPSHVPPQSPDEAAATDAHVDLERAVLPTEVSRPVARALIVAFCLFLAVVPLVQIVAEATGRQKAQLTDLFHQEPNRENFHKYEEEVARNSVFKQAVQPEVQLALSKFNGSGNSNVYIGRDGVLFYRPGMKFVTGRGILDPERIRVKRKRLVDAGVKNAQPDPRPAILAFDADCRKAGAHLVVVPAPDKFMVMPQMAFRFEQPNLSAPLANSDYARFLEDLRGNGVDVFDPMVSVPPPAGTDLPYLRQDTHWTPEWMDAVAKAIAGHVRKATQLPADRAVRYRGEPAGVSRVGDLVDMLDLPAGQTLFPPQQVTIRRAIREDTNAPWASEPSADVLLLGDSFANIYTAEPMGWGVNAGLAPALSRHLQRAIDAIAINGKGASGTRRELARRPEGLAGKRVVIWEFTVRELTDASWDVVPIGPEPAASPAGTPTAKPAAALPANALEIEATIEAVSKVPKPYSVPYPDCLNYMLFHVDKVIAGQYADKQILVVMWAMKKNVWLPPATYAPGRKLHVRLIPMRQAEESVRSGQRADDIEDYKHPPYFVIEEMAR